MRKRTGLRNKWRDGRSTYSIKSKSAMSDKYGTWQQGKQTTTALINGRSRTYVLG